MLSHMETSPDQTNTDAMREELKEEEQKAGGVKVTEGSIRKKRERPTHSRRPNNEMNRE